MSDPISIFEVNDRPDIETLATEFSARGRVQVRDVLTPRTAETLRDALAAETPWGMAIKAGNRDPEDLRLEELRQRAGASRANALMQGAHSAAAQGEYSFRYCRYPMLKAYQESWNSGGLHDTLLEHINTEPFLELTRRITGVKELVKADGQATMFGPQHFLGLHSDRHVGEGWRIAYVLNLTVGEWHPDWGGYLLFFDGDGDVIEGFKPRFNTLNLFSVPQDHAVSYVPPHAPQGRISISGWFRDR